MALSYYVLQHLLPARQQLIFRFANGNTELMDCLDYHYARNDLYYQMSELLRQFVRFFGVGSISAIGHFGVLILLVQVFAVAPVPASAAGALIGAWINYVLNYRYTFRSDKKHSEAVFKFAMVALIGLLLNSLFMWLGVEILAMHYLLSQVVTTGLVFIWNFAANRCWTFRVAGSS